MTENDYVDININRHGGNKQSNKANVRVAPRKHSWRTKILGFIQYRASLGHGTTLKDVCQYFNKDRSQLSGRFTELRVKGFIENTGQERDGFTIYRLKK